MDYFDRPEVSNSNLTALKRELNPPAFYHDPTDAYAFGTLIDAMITEPDRIDWVRKLIDGQPTKDFDKAYRMKREFDKNSTCTSLINGADFQRISISNMDIEHETWTGGRVKFNLDVRCKWDFFGHISGDLKSTTAISQKQFEAACRHFDYYRSRAWYMDIENTDRDIIIGISKVNYKIFFVPIVRDDENYLAGKQQYSELAFKWWALKG